MCLLISDDELGKRCAFLQGAIVKCMCANVWASVRVYLCESPIKA